uniref:Uncharacterized protein n=2 Tax=Nothobranchius kuhntae TaxID=321403 RepID=A0A1A8I627_NOTKU
MLCLFLCSNTPDLMVESGVLEQKHGGWWSQDQGEAPLSHRSLHEKRVTVYSPMIRLGGLELFLTTIEAEHRTLNYNSFLFQGLEQKLSVLIMSRWNVSAYRTENEVSYPVKVRVV